MRIVVTASEGGFVTVHDYLSTVHPWLMSMREDILKAKDVWDEGFRTDFLVDYNGLKCLSLEEKDAWIRHKSQVVDPGLTAAWFAGANERL